VLVLVLVLVLEIRILWVPRDEGDDEDDLNTLLRETAVAGPTLFNKVSYERRRWPRTSSQIEKRNCIFVINDVV
jgi:hypothetical protein